MKLFSYITIWAFLFTFPLFAVGGETVNVALGKSVTVSGGSGAANITDGDLNTMWISANEYRQSFTVDLGGNYAINKVTLHWGVGEDGERSGSNMYDISFGFSEGSSEGGSFTKNEEVIEEKAIFDNISYHGRYVNVSFRGRMGQSRYHIAELEVFGTPYFDENTQQQQESIDILTERLLASWLSLNPDDATTTAHYNAMNEDGSFPNINYKQVEVGSSWQPNRHPKYLRIMAISFRHPESSWYMNQDLLDKIESGLTYFAENRPKVVCSNWWYDDIGDPQDYMIPLLLVKGFLPEEKILQLSSYLKEQTSRFAGGGKNLTWIAEISVHKGCIENNYGIVKKAVDAMASTLTVVSKQGEDGIKPDGSFHQHRGQLYSGGYGLSITSDLSDYMELTVGTLFNEVFTEEKKEIFSNLLLDGHRLLGYRNVMDFGTMGRNISRDNNKSGTNVSVDVLNKMITGDPENAEVYSTWKDHLENSALFPVPGNKYFWNSAIMTQHGGNYYLSAKVVSERTCGTESLNDENVKGFNLPMGATNILTSGDEYNGIYAIWDWTRVPGVTSLQTDSYIALDTYVFGENKFGGGVSNRTNGVIAYEHNFRGLEARKSYFFLDDMLFCMGSDIASTVSAPVITSVNQCYLKGNITLSSTGQGESVIMNTRRETQEFDDLRWVYHDNVGYVFPQNQRVVVENHYQEGSWRSINISGSSTSIRERVFSAWFEHETETDSDNYQYIVVPDKTLQEFKTIANNHGFLVIRNDEKAHAIRRYNKFAIIFYQPGTVVFDNGLSINADKQVIVLLEVEEKNLFNISIADPTYSTRNVTLIINREFENIKVGANGYSTIRFELPSGDYTGSTFTETFIATKEEQWNGIENINKEDVKFAISPNPIQQEASVTFDPGLFFLLECMTLDGRVVQTMDIDYTENRKELSLAGYTPGIYLIRLVGENRSAIQKVIKW